VKNISNYKQTKYKISNGKIEPSRDVRYLQDGSWLMAKYISKCYEKYIPQYVSGKLLDLGCGSVPLYDAYKEYIEEVICTDWENTTHPNLYLDIVHDLNQELPFANDSFDTIIFSDVLEHLANPKKVLHEINRVLVKGGYVLMNVPFYYWLHEEPYDYYRYTEYWYNKNLKEAGFDIIRLEKLGGGLDVVADIKGKYINMVFPWLHIARVYQKLHYYVLNKGILHKKLNRIKHFTLGYFIVLKKE